MPLTQEKKKEIIGSFGENSKDTGSSEVQIAMLTARIRDLTEHSKKNKKDHHPRRGLVTLVAKRKKHMKYLRRTNPDSSGNVIKTLEIRG